MKLIKEVGYVPLPDKAYDMFLQRFKERATGTAFTDRRSVSRSMTC
jgi:hypothetical protein